MTDKNYAAGSSVYHVSEKLIFNKDKLAFQISKIFADYNKINIKVNNEDRLKARLFKEIMEKYNKRINNPLMKLNPEVFSPISNNDIKNFEILYYKLNFGSFGNESSSNLGGTFKVFPLSFVCKKCGDHRYFPNIKKLKEANFDPSKCMIKGCNGQYEQISLLMFCEVCGLIKPLHWKCSNHPVKLERKSKDALSTWRVMCNEPSCKNYKKALDIGILKCNHKTSKDSPKRSLNLDGKYH
ncbi:MAG: hypothetical protein ACTSVV_11020, partial [Promethearchaeota archaeon]